jgi:GT2 family glycosyltransferase
MSAGDRTPWSVVIPSARAENLVRSARTVFDCHPGLDPGRVVVVDDGAREDAEEFLPPGIIWVKGLEPFVFSRNVNLGVRRAPASKAMIVMGDDVEVVTSGTFDRLQKLLEENPRLGLVSPAIEGVVGNPRQRRGGAGGVQEEPEMLVFVCVAISWAAWTRVGELDEQFVGYGCEDDDYSWRVREAGFTLAIDRDCIVRHDGSIRSTFRSRPDLALRFAENRHRFWLKWKRFIPARR